MEKGWTILIVLAVVVIAIVSSDNPGLQLAPGSFATQPTLTDTKTSLAAQECFDALELYDGSNLGEIQPLCEHLNAEEAHAYAEEQGVLSSGACSVRPRADTDGDGDVDFVSVLAILANWHCELDEPACEDPAEDIDEDGAVGFSDVLIVLAEWTGNGVPQNVCECIDSSDNDDDGLSDAFDPGCWANPSDEETYDAMIDDESLFTSECQDGVDNDNDTFVDWPFDSECNSPQGYSEGEGGGGEIAQCSDGLDNDGDGFFDYPNDPECVSEQDNKEARMWEGEIRTVIALVHRPSEQIETPPEAFYHSVLNASDQYSINNFTIENTYGKSWLNGQIVGWLNKSDDEDICNNIDVQEFVIPLIDPYVDFSQVDNLFVFSTYPDSCNFPHGNFGGVPTYQTDEGTFTIGTSSSTNTDANNRFGVLNHGGFDVRTHEYAHALALHHPLNWDCGETTYTTNGQGCDHNAHASYDTVGGGNGHFSAVIKDDWDWFFDEQIIELDHPGEHSYQEYTLSALSIFDTNPKVLKIPRITCEVTGDKSDPCGGDGVGWYYVEFRRPIGHDRGLFASAVNPPEIVVWIDGFLGGGALRSPANLLDMIPEEQTTRSLYEGETFVDPHRGTEITSLSVSDTEVRVSVRFKGPNECGNGVLEPANGEQCDFEDFGGQTCRGLEYAAGDIQCTPSCTFDTTYCFENANRVFVTSQEYEGRSLGTLEDSDARCQALANNAGMYDGLFKAWLSTSQVNASDRLFHSNDIYTLVDGTTLAYNWTDIVRPDEMGLLDGELRHPIDLDENGNFLDAEPVFTGTTQKGLYQENSTCSDWQGFGQVWLGNTNNKNEGWSRSVRGHFCLNSQPIYCFEQPVPETCGNGVLDIAEQCDDGGQEDSDGCSNACQFEDGWLCTGDVFPVCLSDVEDDGIPDESDNCLDVPNGPELGTCIGGYIHSQPCLESNACGPGGFCSMNQEDLDGDSIGDACDIVTCGDGVCSYGEDGVTCQQDCSFTEVGVFASSQNWRGSDLGGLHGADDKCRELAAQEELEGDWGAWLSDSSVSVSERFYHYDLPYVLTNGVSVADHWNDLTTCDEGSGNDCLDNEIFYDEQGRPVQGVAVVWTGSDQFGESALNNCNGWAGSGTGMAGFAIETDSDWTEWRFRTCSNAFRLYCFEHPSPYHT